MFNIDLRCSVLHYNLSLEINVFSRNNNEKPDNVLSADAPLEHWRCKTNWPQVKILFECASGL